MKPNKKKEVVGWCETKKKSGAMVVMGRAM